MKKGQDTRSYERYMALDIHREYILVAAWNEQKDGILTPRRVSIEKFPEWAKKNIHNGDIVVLETKTNVWTIYDIVAPLASRVFVANAAEMGEIANARVKTDKEDVKRLPKLLIGGIVPEVWVPPVDVPELRAFVSYRHRLVKTSTMIRNRLQRLLHKHNLTAEGVGMLTMATLLAELPELGRMDRKKIAVLVGIAPMNYDSGKKRGYRKTKGGRGGVRSVLYMATLVATKHNPVIRAQYQQLLKRGKEKKVALTACMRKFLTIPNALIRDKKPFRYAATAQLSSSSN